MKLMNLLFARETPGLTIAFGVFFLAFGFWQVAFNSFAAGIVLIVFAGLVLATGLWLLAKRRRHGNGE
jgi:hypothetical protein